MTWMVTGAGGMLGTDLVLRLRAHDEEVLPMGRDLLDICDATAVREAVFRHRPTAVVNCASWTAVDDAETREEAALAVNGTAVAPLAEACAEVGATLVQLSSDYVFNGYADHPYAEDAPTDPANAYGRTKLAGEDAALSISDSYVVRTAWLYGAHGHNFVRTMMRLAAEHETIKVVNDQYGQPTWACDLAEQIITLVGSGAPSGIYHGTNSGRTTWHGLAQEVFTLLGHDPARVHPTTTDMFPRPARRPESGVLGHDQWAKAGLRPMRDWREALHAAWPHLTA